MADDKEILFDKFETVSVSYDKEKDKILVNGDTFKISVSIPMDQLTNVYLGSRGKGRARVTVYK